MEVRNEGTGGPEVPRAWGRRERSLIALNVGTMTALALGVAIALNVASDRLVRAHPGWRRDWSEEEVNTLSPETLATLRSLKKPVRIVHYYRPMDPTEKSVAQDLVRVLERYALQSEQIQLEIVDPDRERDRAAPIEAELGLKASERDSSTTNVTVFLSGSNRKDVLQRDVVRIQPANLRANPPEGARILSYNPEEPFTQALRAISDERTANVYWLDGHGESTTDDNTPQSGVSHVCRAISRDNFKVEPLNLATRDVPADADLIVAFCPLRGPSPEETAKLQGYLAEGGKLFLLADADYDVAGWNAIVERYGIHLADPDVIAWDTTNKMSQEAPIIVSGYGARHPITHALYEQRVASIWPRVRPLTVSRDRREVQVEPIVFTAGGTSWGERLHDRKSNGRFDEADDLQGPINLAVASEEIHPNGKKTRLVVTGDADFARNGWLEAWGNRDVFENAIGWLADRSRQIGIKPRIGSSRRVILTAALANSLFYGAGLALPAFVLVLGAVVLWFRRR